MVKQNITFLKIQKFIRSYPIILFYQHNNLSVKQWFDLRIQLKKEKTIDLILLKNTLTENVLSYEDFSGKEKMESLFQGPCFAIGFSNPGHLQEILTLTNQQFPIFLVGGLLNNQFINHLDVSKIVTLDQNIYNLFIGNLNQGEYLNDVLSYPLSNSINDLNQISLNLINCLECLKLNSSKSFIVYV